MLGRKLGKLVFDSKPRADNYVLTRQARRDWYIIINVEVCAVQYHVFIGRFCHASRFQTGLAGFKPRLIPGHFDYFTVSNVHTQKL